MDRFQATFPHRGHGLVQVNQRPHDDPAGDAGDENGRHEQGKAHQKILRTVVGSSAQWMQDWTAVSHRTSQAVNHENFVAREVNLSRCERACFAHGCGTPLLSGEGGNLSSAKSPRKK